MAASNPNAATDKAFWAIVSRAWTCQQAARAETRETDAFVADQVEDALSVWSAE
jgi:hypothetical protein